MGPCYTPSPGSWVLAWETVRLLSWAGTVRSSLPGLTGDAAVASRAPVITPWSLAAVALRPRHDGGVLHRRGRGTLGRDDRHCGASLMRVFFLRRRGKAALATQPPAHFICRSRGRLTTEETCKGCSGECSKPMLFGSLATTLPTRNLIRLIETCEMKAGGSCGLCGYKASSRCFYTFTACAWSQPSFAPSRPTHLSCAATFLLEFLADSTCCSCSRLMKVFWRTLCVACLGAPARGV